MSMTKAEKARLAELEAAVALHWPAYPAPQPMTLEEIKAATVALTPREGRLGTRSAALGWFCNANARRITQGWSTGHIHAWDNVTGDYGSQGGGQMYRSKAEAAMAMRLEMSRQFAELLAGVDRIIRDEEAA